MIVWTGKGILSIVVVFVAVFLFSALLSLFPSNLSIYGSPLGLFLGGIFSLFYGYKWNNQAKERVLIDETTGEKIRVKNSHTFMWLKMEYWGVIFFIGGIALSFQNSIRLGIISILVFIFIIFFFYMNMKKRRKKEIDNVNKINEILNNVINDDK